MADNFSFLNALGIALNARAIDLGGGILYLPGTILMDGTGATLIGQENKAGSLPVTIAIDDDVLLALGYLTDAAVLDANGSINAHIRGMITILLDRLMRGQQTMANSLAVVIASNQTAIPVSGTVTVNEPVTVDGTVSITQPVDVDSTQLPAALGQTNMAGSLPVVIASNQSAIPISGTVTVNQPVDVDSTQLPAALGPTGQANSLPVVLPTDMENVPTTEQRFSIKGRYTEAAVDTSGPNGDIKVEATTSPPTYAGADTPTIQFFDGADAGFGASPRYVYIPLQGSGLAYDKVSLYVYCSLVTGVGVAIDTVVNLYAVEDSGAAELWSPLDTVTLNTDTKRGAKWGKGTGGSAVSSALLTGAGSPVYRPLDALMGPIEYLVVEIDPASAPDDGEIRIVAIRERGSN